LTEGVESGRDGQRPGPEEPPCRESPGVSSCFCKCLVARKLPSVEAGDELVEVVVEMLLADGPLLRAHLHHLHEGSPVIAPRYYGLGLRDGLVLQKEPHFPQVCVLRLSAFSKKDVTCPHFRH
jgi:hypothetical protein